MDNDIIEKIKKELNRTGFPTELNVNEILLNKKWEVYPNEPYIDTETNKIKTLDFRAELAQRYEGITQSSCQLFIECKKSDSIWVFYTDLNLLNYFYRMGFRLGSLKSKKKPGGLDKVSTLHKNFISKISYKYITLFKQDNFYEAQMQVLNCIENSASVDDCKKHLLYPLIVYDGKIFDCYYDKDIKLTEIEYIRFLTGGIPTNPLPTIIDIVTLPYLSTYLDMVKLEYTSIIQP